MFNDNCHNDKCTGFSHIEGLCWDCKIRYNTTNEKLAELREEVYSQNYLDTVLANKINKEILRRKDIEEKRKAGKNVCENCGVVN